MKIMALDLGMKSCGIALSDPSGKLARGYENLHYNQLIYDRLVETISRIIDQENVQEIVIGYPITLSGEEKTQAKQAKRLQKALRKITDINIVLHDERFTSKMAYATMKTQGFSNKKIKERLDEMSAVVILQDYLNQRGDQ